MSESNLENSPKPPQNIHFTMIQNREKQTILTSEKLETEFLTFLLDNDLDLLIIKIVVY